MPPHAAGISRDAAGLYDPKINLRYGIAYLAGAYRTAKGNTHQAYTYYNRGYYYAGKRQGTLVAGIEDTTAASPQSSAAFSDVFTRGFGAQRKAQPDANVTAAGTALAYAPSLTAPTVPTELVEVPLPPRRPAALSGLAPAVAEIGPAHAPAATPQATALAALSVNPAMPQPAAVAGAAEFSVTEKVEVPLPPRRPSAVVLASVAARSSRRRHRHPAPSWKPRRFRPASRPSKARHRVERLTQKAASAPSVPDRDKAETIQKQTYVNVLLSCRLRRGHACFACVCSLSTSHGAVRHRERMRLQDQASNAELEVQVLYIGPQTDDCEASSRA